MPGMPEALDPISSTSGREERVDLQLPCGGLPSDSRITQMVLAS